MDAPSLTVTSDRYTALEAEQVKRKLAAAEKRAADLQARIEEAEAEQERAAAAAAEALAAEQQASAQRLAAVEALAATSLPTQSNEYTAPFFQRSCTTDSCITAWHNGAYAAYYQLDLALGVPLPEFRRLARATTRVGA